MPVFPNISQLVTKATLSGDEVIQISATEKTTLRAICEQLGFTPSSLLTGLTEGTPGTIDIPVATDTLIQALSKIVALAGSNKLIILPVPYIEESSEGFRLVVLVDNVVDGGAGGLAATITVSKPNSTSQPQLTIYYRTWAQASEHPLLTCDTIQEVADWATSYNDAGGIFSFWGEAIVENSGTSITFNPGDVIYHTGGGISEIVVPMYYWAASKYMFTQNSSVIVTQVNVTKSMFNRASGGNLNNVTYLFSEDFDDSPGTTYQCITIQQVRKASGAIVFLVNKGGYNT